MEQDKKPRVHHGRSQTLVFLVALLLLVSLACNLPTSLPIENPFDSASYVETSVVKTLVSIEIKQPLPGTDDGPGGTQMPGEDNSLTPTPTDFGATPVVAKIDVSENTNCRTGQGTSFERLMIL